jgi:hypothetical protein
VTSTTDNREVFEEGNKGVKLKRLSHRKQYCHKEGIRQRERLEDI